ATNNTIDFYTLNSALTTAEDATNFTIIIPDDEAAAPTSGKRWVKLTTRSWDGTAAEAGVTATLDAIQTLTNKTLTAPTITGIASFVNLAITGYIEFDGAGAQVAAWSGADLVGITGTAGTATYLAQWNADGDLVDTTIEAAWVDQDVSIGSGPAFAAAALTGATTIGTGSTITTPIINAILAKAGEIGIVITADGAVELNYDEAKMLHTVATGVHVNSQLQITHDGTDGEIRNRLDTGWLKLRADKTGGTAVDLIAGDPDGPVELYWVGSKKLETTNTGALVTGSIDTSAAGTWTYQQQNART
ncbi:unnamed protein product, partial [marine sediment metagenome]